MRGRNCAGSDWNHQGRLTLHSVINSCPVSCSTGRPALEGCRMRMLPVPIASRRANVQLHPRLSLLRYGSGDTKRSARGTTVARLEEVLGFYLFDVWERFQGGTGKSQTSNSCATGRPSFDTRATLQSLICSVLCAGSCSLTSSAVGSAIVPYSSTGSSGGGC